MGTPTLGLLRAQGHTAIGSPQGRAACFMGWREEGFPQASGGQAPLAPPLGKPPWDLKKIPLLTDQNSDCESQAAGQKAARNCQRAGGKWLPLDKKANFGLICFC